MILVLVLANYNNPDMNKYILKYILAINFLLLYILHIF